MNQTTLWHDTIFDALGAAVQAAGGTKKVANKLWPAMDSTSATARLRSALNPEHAQKLDPDELVAIARLGKEANDNGVMAFLARELGYSIEPLTDEETAKNAKKARRLALLDELKKLEDE